MNVITNSMDAAVILLRGLPDTEMKTYHPVVTRLINKLNLPMDPYADRLLMSIAMAINNGALDSPDPRIREFVDRRVNEYLKTEEGQQFKKALEEAIAEVNSFPETASEFEKSWGEPPRLPR